MIFKPKVINSFEAASKYSFVYQDHPNLLTPVDFANIRSVTTQLHDKISSGTFDSPSWDFIRTAKLAARMYAPLGTFMSLGDHVRLSRTFLEAFKVAYEIESKDEDAEEVLKLHNDLKVCFHQCRYFLLSITITKGLSRPTCTMGYQRRSDTTAFSSSCYFISITCPIHLVPHFVFNFASWTSTLAADICDHILCCS